MDRVKLTNQRIKTMTNQLKCILINAIIRTLNNHLERVNKKLCAENLNSEQKPLHGEEMFIKLAYADEIEINKIAVTCGL